MMMMMMIITAKTEQVIIILRSASHTHKNLCISELFVTKSDNHIKFNLYVKIDLFKNAPLVV